MIVASLKRVQVRVMFARFSKIREYIFQIELTAVLLLSLLLLLLFIRYVYSKDKSWDRSSSDQKRHEISRQSLCY